MDLLRLQKALLLCRLAANSTYLVDKNPPGYSTKLQELDVLLDQLTAEEDRKIILFSEWTRMLDLIEPFAEKRALPFVRLDGSVPQKKRQALINEFQNDPACKLFMTTNAGSTGLNLQAANTIINVDLPWNPAILEQRIARAHRMGQKRPVQVYLLVTEDTLEENLLATLSAKQELALAALDPESDVTKIDLVSGIEELKRRLEVLLGTAPVAHIDESGRAGVEREVRELARKERIAVAGGQLLGAAFAFMGEMFAQHEETEQTRQTAQALKQKLSECLAKDAEGKIRMTISLPDESVLDNLAKSLAQIMAGA
jgi:superfamily II DNA/RNA helicase